MIQPILHNVVVKPFMSSEISKGGLFIPDSVRKPSNKVKVVAAGNGTKKRPMLLKEGDIGYRVQDWGQEIIIDGEKHFIMEQSAIIALQ